MPIKNFNQSLNSMIDKVRATLPDADVSSGTVIRELLEAYAQEAASLYSSISGIQSLQSIKSSSGQDLDNLAANYSKQRKSAQKATSVVIFTRANLSPSDSITISSGTAVSTLSTSLVTGAPIQFKTNSDVVFLGAQREVHKATANQYRALLDAYGIADAYAVPVSVTATASGTASNVAKGTVRRHSLGNVGNVINIVSGSGGSDAETDDQFRKRLLLVFAGSNLSTEFGLRSFLLDMDSVQDVALIGPGDPLMIRDGTKVSGTTIEVPGSGGMIDIYVSGNNLERNQESFIFTDKSADKSVATADNDYVLGVATYVDPLTGMPVALDYRNRKVILTNQDIELRQPIDSIVSVNGSQSGAFVAGINYELIKDVTSPEATVYSNSGFGSDRLRWLSGTSSITNESLLRSSYPNISQDFTKYSGIESVDDVFYIVAINREQVIVTDQTDIISSIDSSRSYDPTVVVRVITKHAPVTAVTAVENFVTGEKYKVGFYTVDGSIYISGRSLPSSSDAVLVSYSWQKFFDPSFDYSPTAQNAIEWHSSNVNIADVDIGNSSGSVIYPDNPAVPITIPAMDTPTELMITVKARGLNTRAVYLQGTSMTAVLNQQQRLLQDVAMDSTNVYAEFYIVPPSDERTGTVMGGSYEKDVLSSYRVLARQGQYVGRVYPNNNPLSLVGSLTSVGDVNKSVIIYQNITAGDIARVVDYVTSGDDPTYVGIKSSDIGTVPRAGDEVSVSFLWEVRNPISQGANVGKDNNGGDIYILGATSGPEESIIRDVNNPSYVNPNTGLAQMGNYDKIAYIGSISATNGRQFSYKRFATIDRITVSDVQANAQSTTFTGLKIDRFQAPVAGTNYAINYTYKAPKEGERITVAYYYNKLVNDVTKAVENQRIINTDILIKAGIEVPLAVGINAVVADGVNPATAQASIVTRLTEILNTNALGGSMEPSFVTSELFKVVPGLVSVNYTRFSRLSDSSGVKSITFNANEYFSIEPADVVVAIASGKDMVFTNYYTEGRTNPSFRPTGQASTCPAEKLVVADPKMCAPR